MTSAFSDPICAARAQTCAAEAQREREQAAEHTRHADALETFAVLVGAAASDVRSEEEETDLHGLLRDVTALCEDKRRFGAALMRGAEMHERHQREWENGEDDETAIAALIARCDRENLEDASELPTMHQRNGMMLAWQDIRSRAEALDIDISDL